MEFKDLLGVGMTCIVLVIGLAYGLQVTSDVQSDMTANSLEYNATEQGKAAVAKIPNKLGTIITIILAAVVLGILVRYLWGSFVQKEGP